MPDNEQTPDELEQQNVVELPNREAMSLILRRCHSGHSD
jgi:hypothetical protein